MHAALSSVFVCVRLGNTIPILNGEHILHCILTAMDTNKVLNIRLHNCQNEIKSIDEQIKTLYQRRKKLKEEADLLERQLSDAKNAISKDKFTTPSFDWSDQVQSVLESVFDLKKFRSHQLSAINATLSGYDVLLIMPTGGGKSLCFQLTALISKGLTLVVSPLISLMEDQLNSLNKLNIPTAVFSSNTSKDESNRILNLLANPDDTMLRILYVTPEKLAKSKRFLAQLEKCYNNNNLKRLVIDEVHCCSQWGHDFRTDYQFLGIMRNQFPETPILGLTATATSLVISDIQKILNISGCYIFKDSFFRPNLKYFVKRVDDMKKEDLIEEIICQLRTTFANQSGLIYCLTIKEVEELSIKLRSAGIKAMPYHAQLLPEQRTKAYEKWFSNKVKVIIATIAFGMGINKNDVRFVIHFSMSKSFENYYQETGRAGRDGKPADCVLYFKFADIFRATSLVYSERNGLMNVYSMVSYCLDKKTCRKEKISNYFDDTWDNKCENHCDNCLTNESQDIDSVNITGDMETLNTILTHCTKLEKRITFLKLIDIWLGKGEKKLKPDGVQPTKYNREKAQDIIGYLLVNNYLKEEFHFTPYSTISYANIGFAWLTRSAEHVIQCPLSLKDSKNKSKLSGTLKTKKRKFPEPQDCDIITLD